VAHCTTRIFLHFLGRTVAVLRTLGGFQVNGCPFQGQAFADSETRVNEDNIHVPQVVVAFGYL
jgi:hypothetical protein